jgi:hypothetical protein
VHLEQGSLSLVSTTEELLGRESSCSGLENQGYGHRGSVVMTMQHFSIRKRLALSSPARGGCSVGMVRSRTQATEFN